MLVLVIVPGLITSISEAAIRTFEGIPSRGCTAKMQELHAQFFYPQKDKSIISSASLAAMHKIEREFSHVYTQGSPSKAELDVLLSEFPEYQILVAKVPIQQWLGRCLSNWDYRAAVKSYAQSLYDLRAHGIPYTTVKLSCSFMEPISEAKFKALTAVINEIEITDTNGNPFKRNWVQYLG